MNNALALSFVKNLVILLLKHSNNLLLLLETTLYVVTKLLSGLNIFKMVIARLKTSLVQVVQWQFVTMFLLLESAREYMRRKNYGSWTGKWNWNLYCIMPRTIHKKIRRETGGSKIYSTTPLNWSKITLNAIMYRTQKSNVRCSKFNQEQ